MSSVLKLADDGANAKPAKEKKISLFEAVKIADQNYKDALAVARERLIERSVIVKKILVQFGKGPYEFEGNEVTIAHKSDIYFFRNKNKNVDRIK